MDVLCHVAFNAKKYFGKMHKEKVIAPSFNDFWSPISILATCYKYIIKHGAFFNGWKIAGLVLSG